MTIFKTCGLCRDPQACTDGWKGRTGHYCTDAMRRPRVPWPSEPDATGHTQVEPSRTEPGVNNSPDKGLDGTLAERGTRYGEFKDQAVYAQGMADIARSSPNWALMAPDQKEGLSIIFNKIGRILNGDPDYSDSWHDIAGYATLVDKRLKSEGK